tara:strand:- start:4527 stop:5363 length:837 start_codon:yes stop_codon:yes gene_type:complete
MKVSVIIPTFNRKHTLTRAIESVLNQTYQLYEIIVVDDCSKDGTFDWVQTRYPFINLIRLSSANPPRGVSYARNQGIKMAKYDWLALLDSDDEWLPQKLERQIQLITDKSNSLFCHTNEIWIRNGIRVNQMKKHQKYGGYIFNKCLDICRISPSSSLFHKSVLDEVGNFDEKLKVCEDYDLWLRISAKYDILFLDEALIKKYGGHNDQLSKINGGIEQYRIIALENIMSSGMLKKRQFNKARDSLLKKYYIYEKGLKKREKIDELEKVKNKILYWTYM